jgi:hypothetical protein
MAFFREEVVMQGGGEAPEPWCFVMQEIFAHPCLRASCHFRGYNLSAMRSYRSMLRDSAQSERAPEIRHVCHMVSRGSLTLSNCDVLVGI